MYSLKIYNDTLVKFDMENKPTLKIFNIEVVSNKKELFPEAIKQDVTSETLKEFLQQRIVPKNRTFVENILQTQNLDYRDIKGIIDISKGLSLTDCYWIANDDTLKFENYNLFDNNFSEVLSLVAFTGYTSKIKGIATSPEFTTDGALPKAWRRIDNNVFLFKGSTAYLKASNGGNEPYSEYYICQLEDAMNIEHVSYDLEKWKGMLASTCPLFTSKEYSYVPIYQASGKKDIDDVHTWCVNNGYQDAFADMIMLDALTYNWDRHLGNFGVLKDNKTGKYIKFAPLFDNGAGLLSDADINVFKSKHVFEDYYKNDRELQKSNYGVDYKVLVRLYCDKKQIAKLRKVLNFRFTKHIRYNLDDERLELLNLMVNNRAKELIEVIENASREDND